MPGIGVSTARGILAGMGRRATNAGRLSLDVDAALKLRASIAAMKAGVSLTQLVERGIVLALAELRAKAKAEPDEHD